MYKAFNFFYPLTLEIMILLVSLVHDRIIHAIFPIICIDLSLCSYLTHLSIEYSDLFNDEAHPNLLYSTASSLVFRFARKNLVKKCLNYFV